MFSERWSNSTENNSKADILWSHTEEYVPKLRESDKAWKGEVLPRKKTLSKVIATDVELYNEAMETLKNESLQFAELHLEAPNVEHAKKRAAARETGSKPRGELQVWKIAGISFLVLCILFFVFRRLR